MIDEAMVSSLLARLETSDEQEREEAADSVTDQVSSYSPEQARRLVSALSRLAVAEQNPVAREAQLHAAAELAEWHPSARSAASVLTDLDRDGLTLSEQEYLDFLSEQ